MKPNNKGIWLLMCWLSTRIVGKAQDAPPAFASWLLPGGSFQVSEKVNLIFQPGWNPQQKSGVLWGQGNIKFNKYLTVNTSYLYIKVPSINGVTKNQFTFLNGATLTIPVQKFIIENRGLVWNRFVRHADDLHQYRNRVRFSRLLKIKNNTARLFVFDEITFNIKGLNWARNRVGVGTSSDFGKHTWLEVFYANQRERHGKIHLLFVSLIWLINPPEAG